MRRTTTTFLKRARTRVFDQNPPHHAGRHGEEVRAIGPLDLLNVHQPEKRLVHQGGGLKDVILPLPGHLSSGQSAQLVIDERHQLPHRGLVAGGPVHEEGGHMTATINARLSSAATHESGHSTPTG